MRLLVSADGYILAGHARLKAAEKAGIFNCGIICIGKYLPMLVYCVVAE